MAKILCFTIMFREERSELYVGGERRLNLSGWLCTGRSDSEGGKTVNQNINTVVFTMLIAFALCCILFYVNRRQQDKIRKERDEERELYNKQLAEALQAAQVANNSKTTFLSNMSHDIRTPMNAVLGYTTLLAKDAENPDKVRNIQKRF